MSKKYDYLRAELLKLKQAGALKNNVRINEAEVVVNGEKFVDSHISIIDSRRKEKKLSVMPYYDRLAIYFKNIQESK